MGSSDEWIHKEHEVPSPSVEPTPPLRYIVPFGGYRRTIAGAIDR